MDWIDMHMFVYGANGLGKKLYAEILYHQSSIMQGTQFICGIIDSDPDRAKRDIFGYLEDEIFHPGFIEKTGQGTLYLHDISRLTDETLKELIKSIHEKSYFPVNSKEIKTNNARFILSTDLISPNIRKLSLDSSFNKINMRFFSMPWAEPPDDLALEWHEPDDFDLVIKLIIKKVCKENNIEPIDISVETFDILINHHCFDNFHDVVCEIENAVKKKISKNSSLDSPRLEPDCLSNELLNASTSEYAEFYLNRNDVSCVEEVEEREQNISSHKEEPQEKIIYFYQKDDLWKIGINEKYAFLNNLKGLNHIYTILQNSQEISSLQLMKLLDESKSPSINASKVLEYKDSKAFKLKVLDTPNDYIDNDNYIPLERIDSSIKKLEEEKDNLEEIIDCAEKYDQSDILSAKDKLAEVNKDLKLWKEKKDEKQSHHKRRRSYDEDKARLAVKKTIDKALLEISKKLPELSEFINEHTIKTGYDCMYVPLPNKDPNFILYEPENS